MSIRAATAADRPGIIELCRASLGWRAGDPNEDFFAWKHDQNPFGRSPAWVAVAPDGELVGLRVFLRWDFRLPNGASRRAVRAVDTATHPDWQGRGIFTRLTTGALPDLEHQGIDMVFNTPNDKSRPGYLKMGWQQIGRVPVAVRLRSPRSAAKVLGARAAAEKWSTPTAVGLDAAGCLGDETSVARLVERAAAPPGIATDRSPAYLSWRYSFTPLRYRVVPIGDRLDDGIVVFRLRRRGTALEATIAEVIVPPGTSARRAVGYVLRATGADYAIRTGPGGAAGFLPAPSIGPVLTWRPVVDPWVPALEDLSLTLGDVELF